MSKLTLNKSRYPGIRAFERNENTVFFGRKREAKKLYNLIKAKPLVVLFSKSGIGKSSLINAGLEPLLEVDYFQVIKVRLQSTNISSVETVINELKPFVNETKLKNHSKGKPGFWEYLRACDFKRGEEELTPILIFDQFEEFFEHDKKDQKALNQELADMVSNRLPERIQQSLRAIPFRDRTQEQLDWHSPIPVKFIFAIRSDRMSQMDGMSEKIPSILHNRFHLKPLGIEAAKEAIVEPAISEVSGFDTMPFSYHPDALETIIKYLKNKNDEIESFQLQLLCRNIERTVYRKNEKNVVVQETDFGGSKGIRSILNNYYEQEITELGEEERPLARKFFEEGLIVGGRRVGISEGVESETFGIGKELLSKLLASRLLRAENTHLGRSYELSHDTLVAPILQSFEIRRRREESAEILRKQKEHETQLKAERKKRNRARMLAVAGFVLFVISAGLGFLAAKQSQIAKKAQKEAEDAKVIAERQRDRANEARKKIEVTQLKMAEINLESGKANMEVDKYEAASENFNLVLALEPNIDTSIVSYNKELFTTARQLLKQAKSKNDIQKDFDGYMKSGNDDLKAKRYQSAYAKFKAARKLDVSAASNRQSDLKIDAAENELIRQVGVEMDKAGRFSKANDCVLVKEKIKKVESISRLLNYQLSNADKRKIRTYKNKCN